VASFVVKQSRETEESRIEVETHTPDDKSGESDLGPGVHRFMLIVENDAGVQSEPVISAVEVVAVDTRLPVDFSPDLRRPPVGIDRGRQKGKGGAGPPSKGPPPKKIKPARPVKSTKAKKVGRKPKPKKKAPER
jgi:hypothetical protein